MDDFGREVRLPRRSLTQPTKNVNAQPIVFNAGLNKKFQEEVSHISQA